MKNKKNRSIKVYGQSGYNYKTTPTIMLKGQWLAELGFEIGDYISVCCEDGKIIITPDAERTALEQAEKELMNIERKDLSKRFQKEKKRMHAQFVAERNAEYGCGKEDANV